jgi:hypothetical protein
MSQAKLQLGKAHYETDAGFGSCTMERVSENHGTGEKRRPFSPISREPYRRVISGDLMPDFLANRTRKTRIRMRVREPTASRG